MSQLESDLAGPIEDAGSTVLHVDEAPGSVVGEPDPSVDSLVNAPTIATPAPVAGSGEVILAVEAPWYIKNFDSSIVGCPVVSQTGTAVPAEFADQVISIGVANGVTIVKR